MVSIYTDGASGNKDGKPGGWGWVAVRDGKEVLGTAFGGSPATSNNRMELSAAIEGLRALLVMKADGRVASWEVCELVSDSQYTLGIASGQWNPTKNIDLAGTIHELYLATGVRTRWVRGHQGYNDKGELIEPWNHRVDSLAGRGKRDNTPPDVLAKQDAKRARSKR